MIRKAKPQDVDAIVELAVESVSTIDPIPELKIDREAMRDMTEQCLQPAHFLYVSEIDGVVVGALGAHAAPSFWHKGLAVSVLLHYARNRGEWAKLMREFSRWCKSRSGVKIAVLEAEGNADPRMIQYMARLGFGRVTQNVTYVRPL
jgi:GNAT superfamily N-acetyltransferase